jgi:hypothetical protein
MTRYVVLTRRKLASCSLIIVFGVQVRLGREEPEYIDLGKPGETDTGSVCDIVVRENIAIRSIRGLEPFHTDPDPRIRTTGLRDPDLFFGGFQDTSNKRNFFRSFFLITQFRYI